MLHKLTGLIYIVNLISSALWSVISWSCSNDEWCLQQFWQSGDKKNVRWIWHGLVRYKTCLIIAFCRTLISILCTWILSTSCDLLECKNSFFPDFYWKSKDIVMYFFPSEECSVYFYQSHFVHRYFLHAIIYEELIFILTCQRHQTERPDFIPIKQTHPTFYWMPTV